MTLSKGLAEINVEVQDSGGGDIPMSEPKLLQRTSREITTSRTDAA
jgi:hypothetical protein